MEGCKNAEHSRRGGVSVAVARSAPMTTVVLQPIVALIAGVLILLMPKLLNYVVALYLIVIGVLGLSSVWQ
jgi:hypothetical protein